jgi:hypothetical protein
MKKLMFSVCLVLSVIFTSNAQESKGPRGGVLIGEEAVKFEFVNVGNKFSFYPVDQNGGMLKTVPTSADISFTLQLTTEHEDYNNVPFENGCFTVTRSSEVPVFIVLVKTQNKDKEIVVKYRVPGIAGR